MAEGRGEDDREGGGEMRSGTIKVYADYRDYKRELELYIIEEGGDYRAVAQPIDMIFKRFQLGEVISGPTLRVPDYFALPMIKAFAELAGTMGVKRTDESKTEGLYEATKYHLEDMRKLMKLTE